MPTPAQRPASCFDLFLTFTWLGLQGFGGVLSVVQRELVERKQWLTQTTFAEDWALAQTLPGPNVVNLAVMLGGRSFGVRGSVCAASGLLLIPAWLMLAVVFACQSWAHVPAVSSALRGMGVVAAGMVLATGWRFYPVLRHHLMGWPIAFGLAAVSALLAGYWHWPWWQVIALPGGVSCLWCAWLMSKEKQRERD